MVSEQIQSPVRYPSDLIDEEWEIIETIISDLDPYTTGRPRTIDLREIMNAIFYIILLCYLCTSHGIYWSILRCQISSIPNIVWLSGI